MDFEFPASPAIGEYAINPDAQRGTHDEKGPPLSQLYPERDRYLTVDPARYYTSEHMEREWASLWCHTWTCAARESDMPVVGSWCTYNLGRESFIVVRTGEHDFSAFYNVCRHRGNRLLRDDFGVDAVFTCGFHGWQWRADGRISTITDRAAFRKGALCGNLNLRRVRCEKWAGFLFINMDEAAEPLETFLSELPPLLRTYRMDDMHVVKDVVIELQANWKIGVEAFIEIYHIQRTHAQALPFVDDVHYQVDFYRNGHGRLHTSFLTTSPRVGEDKRNLMHPVLKYQASEVGLDPDAFENRALALRAAAIAAKRKVSNPFGIDYSEFTDSQIVDDWNYSIFPNMTFNTHPEGVLVMRFLPHPTDPEKHYYHVWIISRRLKEGAKLPAYMGVEPGTDISGRIRPARQYRSAKDPQLGEVLEQDVPNIESVQQGLRSRSFDCNKYSEQEQRIMQMHAEIDRYMRAYK